jgi:hypothetical protein
MISLLLTAAILSAPAPPVVLEAAQSQRARDSRSLRERIESRFEVVPLRDGIGLRPRVVRDVRMIEVTDAGIAIDGAPVTGGELRKRLVADADAVLQLSYLDAAERRSVLGLGEGAPDTREAEPDTEPEVTQPDRGDDRRRDQVDDREPIHRNRMGERIRVFGSVEVDRDELIDGQVVAVLGSVRVDGEVTDQVVAVLGSVNLGPDARVAGDVISIGGPVRRAPGAVVQGAVREIGLSESGIGVNIPEGAWWGLGWAPFAFRPFEPSMRLMATVFRFLLLALLCGIVVLLARNPVESIAQRVSTEPLKAVVVGVLAELLFIPALVLTCVVLAATIIGIPLLLFLPFLIVAFLVILLVGFAGTAYTVGRLASNRSGTATDQPFIQVGIGLFIILLPVFVARLLGLTGGPMHLFAMLIGGIAFLVEYVAWTTGLGAALIAVFTRWRARRPAGGGSVQLTEETTGPAPGA